MRVHGTAVTKPGRQPGWYIPWLFVGLFLVVFAVNGVMIVLAFDTFPGLATEQAFEEGIAYNRALAGAKAQEAQGWTVTTHYEPLPGRDAEGVLSVSALDRAGIPIGDALVTAEFRRPTVAGHDVALTLNADGRGGYRGSVRLPLPGLWDVRIRVARGATDHQLVERLSIAQ